MEGRRAEMKPAVSPMMKEGSPRSKRPGAWEVGPRQEHVEKSPGAAGNHEPTSVDFRNA